MYLLPIFAVMTVFTSAGKDFTKKSHKSHWSILSQQDFKFFPKATYVLKIYIDINIYSIICYLVIVFYSYHDFLFSNIWPLCIFHISQALCVVVTIHLQQVHCSCCCWFNQWVCKSKQMKVSCCDYRRRPFPRCACVFEECTTGKSVLKSYALLLLGVRNLFTHE